MRTFTQLSYREREKIYRGLCDGKSRREIAILLDRDPSSICREVRRNSDKYGYMYPDQAHSMTQKRKHKHVPKIDKDHDLKEYVIKQLKKRFSPRSIAGGWGLESSERSITAEAIYQWIYGPEGEKLQLKKLLVRSRRKRGLKRKPKRSKIKDRVSVHDRPGDIDKRIEVGHFEADLIFNRGSQSQNVLTVTERVTRYALLIKNENKRTKTVIDALIEHIKRKKLDVKSITFDNGSEFAGHKKLHDLGIKTYFCDPGSPWQKGSIENLNGVLRRYLPFKMPASEVSKGLILKVNKKVNDMPRAILGFKTANQAFMESRVKAALPAVEAF